MVMKRMEGDAASFPPSRDAAKDAYEAIASVYDDFTAEHDYQRWLGNLLTVLKSHGLRGNRLLDVACGTGKSFLPMLDRGWEVTACDVAPSMLEQARAKAGDAVELSVADMRELPRLGDFDLVWALGDAVNYLLSRQELRSALSSMRRQLAPGGLLMFDTNTLRIYRTFFSETEVVDSGDRKLVWEGQVSPDVEPGHICESRFYVEEAGEVTDAHVHRQRHFSEEEVRACLDATGLTCLDVVGHGFDGVFQRPLDPSLHTKAVFLAASTTSPREVS